MTFDDNPNWFPQISPDNKLMAFIADTSDENKIIRLTKM